MKKVIVTGVSGQMGSYFSEFLLEKGFQVIGTIRRLSVSNHQNFEHLKLDKNFILEPMDLGDNHSISSLINKYKPDYFINCAANSFVPSSWNFPEQHIEFNTLGVLRQLEAIRKYSPSTRYINFGSSEEMGDVLYSPQDEKHPPRSRSIYAASKVAARQVVKVYRESYNLYALQCYCFNYESQKRGVEFISRKITTNVARILNEIQLGYDIEPMKVGNIYAKRDWSHALDFVDGVWRMLNQENFGELREQFRNHLDKNYAQHQMKLTTDGLYNYLCPRLKEFVFSSNETHTVKEFIEKSFNYAGIEGHWSGEDMREKFLYHVDDTPLVEISEEFYRLNEVQLLLGNSTLARQELGWKPMVSFDQLVQKMTEHDIKNICS